MRLTRTKLDPFYAEAYLRGVYFLRSCDDPACTDCLQMGAPEEPPQVFKDQAKRLAPQIAFLLHVDVVGRA